MQDPWKVAPAARLIVGRNSGVAFSAGRNRAVVKVFRASA
jgi:hypothetical protein